MKNKHVTDKIRSKKLKEVGLPQEGGLFYYSEQLGRVITHEQFMNYDPYNTDLLQDDGFREAVDRTYRAFLSTELNEWLPDWVYSVKEGERFYCWCSGDKAGESRNIPEKLEAEGTGILDEIEPIYADTEQNAKADMILYLFREGIIK